jgi:REP-associated tyrosine transposase
MLIQTETLLMTDEQKKHPHTPLHKFSYQGAYIVTASTYERKLLYLENEHLDFLTNELHRKALKFEWRLDAWAVFPNHYHFIAHPLGNPKSMPAFIKEFHGSTAHHLNKIENKQGRRVWCQYWDTQLTFHNSYLARLKYVQENPVRHGIVSNSIDYAWCSEAYFRKSASKPFQQTLDKFKTDTINVVDDFDLEGFSPEPKKEGDFEVYGGEE